MQITLQRDLSTQNETLGRLVVNGRAWDSIERPWIATEDCPAGEPGRSCIPVGEYRLEAHSTEQHPKCWALVNQQLGVYHWPWEVPASKRAWARSVCLIHPANWASELRGCVALGKRREKEPTGVWCVRDSRDAINELRSLLGMTVDISLAVS